MADGVIDVKVETAEAVAAVKKLGDEFEKTEKQASAFGRALNTTFAPQAAVHTNNMLRALSGLKDAFQDLVVTLFAANTAIAGFFAGMVKELNKLQGFLSIMTVTTKNTEAAGAQFEYLRRVANTLGLDINTLTSNYAKLLASIPDVSDKMQIAQKAFLGVSMAARTLHATNQDTQLMFYAVTQIASKGVVSMEELRRQLGEKMPGAMEIAARSLQTNVSELEQAIRKGTVDSTKFLRYFSDELIRTFADSSAVAANTVDAAINRLLNTWTDFVKSVLDSGGATKISGVFDAIREKLSDPAVFATMRALVENLADSFTKFVKGLTAQDIRNAFQTLETAIRGVAEVTQMLVKAFVWVIDNSRLVGTIVGALVGAGKGAAVGFAVAGPAGALVGAAGGAIIGGGAGYWAGSQFQTDDQSIRSARVDARSQEIQAEANKQIGLVVTNQLIPILTSAFKFSMQDISSILPLLEKNAGLNSGTASTLTDILKNPQYKNLQERQAAALEFASTGQVLGPRGTLADVMRDSDKGPKGNMGRRYDPWHVADDYLERLEKAAVKERELTEIQKLNLALESGQLKFRNDELEMRAFAAAKAIDEAKAEEQRLKLLKEEERIKYNMIEGARDMVSVLDAETQALTMTNKERLKLNQSRRFEEMLHDKMSRLGPMTLEAQKAFEALAETLRNDFGAALDENIEKSLSWITGLRQGFADVANIVEDDAAAMRNVVTHSFNSMSDALENFAKTGKFSFKSLIDSMIADLLRLAIQKAILGPLFNFMSGMFGGSDSGGPEPLGGPVLGEGILPTFAWGGSPPTDRPSWVGEHGTELFVPHTAGTIVPTHRLGGSVVFAPTINVDSRTDRAEVLRAIDQALRVSEARMQDRARRGGNNW